MLLLFAYRAARILVCCAASDGVHTFDSVSELTLLLIRYYRISVYQWEIVTTSHTKSHASPFVFIIIPPSMLKAWVRIYARLFGCCAVFVCDRQFHFSRLSVPVLKSGKNPERIRMVQLMIFGRSVVAGWQEHEERSFRSSLIVE